MNFKDSTRIQLILGHILECIYIYKTLTNIYLLYYRIPLFLKPLIVTFKLNIITKLKTKNKYYFNAIQAFKENIFNA